jgi:hypothetical protein
MGQTAQHDQSLWTVRSYAFIAQHTEQTLQSSPQANLSIRERSLLGYIAITIALARKDDRLEKGVTIMNDLPTNPNLACKRVSPRENVPSTALHIAS